MTMELEPDPASAATAASAAGDQPTHVHKVTVRYRRWRLFGLRFGPHAEVPMQVVYHPEAGIRCERLDHQPVAELANLCKDQLDQAQNELMHLVREQRVSTAEFKRRTEANCQQPATVRTVKHETTARISELRERRWREAMKTPRPGLDPATPPQSAAAVVAPFEYGWSEAAPAPDPAKTTSSVFRYDRQETTDRIAKLREAKTATDPFAGREVSASGMEPDEITARMARHRRQVESRSLKREPPPDQG